MPFYSSTQQEQNAVLSPSVKAMCIGKTVADGTLISTTAITYNVISTTGQDQSMGVMVDSKLFPLQASKDIPILHTGTAPSGLYNYAILDEQGNIIEKEAFQRHLDGNVDKTPNEFYNRTWTTQQPLISLPMLLDPLPGIHRIDSRLHAKNQIPTIYLSGDQTQIDLMHGNIGLSTKVTLDMHFIDGQNDHHQGTKLYLAGRSSKWVDKVSYTLKTPKDQLLFGYRRLKLRASHFDPSYIREALCYDIMHAMGLPASETSYIRLIINDQPIGLFLMVEAYKDNWYENEFANGGGAADNNTLPNGHGATYQGISGSSLAYLGNNVTSYAQTYKVESKASKHQGGEKASNSKQVIDFTKFLSEAPTSTPDAVSVWNKHIDMESVIRSLVVEIIAGFADGYLGNTNNFFLYDNLAEDRLTYLAADFDITIGNTFLTLADQWSGNYTKYPGFSMRPLTQKMIQVPDFKARVEQLLDLTSTHLINIATIQPRIDGLFNMIQQDVDWDATLPRVNHLNVTSSADLRDGDKQRSPPNNPDAAADLFSRKQVPFHAAVYTPLDYISLSSVTQWFDRQSKALQDYFTLHPPFSLV